jgi:hypothetical protein
MGYEAKVLADSVSPAGVRLTTLEVTFPRFILAEVNTHRMLSRSSASSRAIPVEKRIKAVEEDPFVPEAFGRNRKGMQATEVLEGVEADAARAAWLHAAQMAVGGARDLARIGVHKQYANRLLEPFLWHTAIISATEWENFFALRCHPDAQPEFRRTAEAMRDARDASRPWMIHNWHLPYVDAEEVLALKVAGMSLPDVALVSSMRCARVSYLTHDGKRDPEADRARALELIAAGHMSPFEHAAHALAEPTFVGNFRGWAQRRKFIAHEDNFAAVIAGREAVSA